MLRAFGELCLDQVAEKGSHAGDVDVTCFVRGICVLEGVIVATLVPHETFDKRDLAGQGLAEEDAENEIGDRPGGAAVALVEGMNPVQPPQA